MKKITIFVSIFLCLLFCSCEKPVDPINEHKEKTENNTEGLEFEVVYEPRGVTYYKVIGYKGTSKDVYIPDVYENEKVMVISKTAFKENNIIENVYISPNVKTIENEAFRDCINLKKIVFNDIVETIPERCFFNCKNLIDVTMPKNLKFIEESAFSGCEILRNISLLEGLEKIKSNAFNRTSIRKVILPSTLYELSSSAFNICDVYNLHNVEIKQNYSFFIHTTLDEKPLIEEHETYNVLTECDFIYGIDKNDYVVIDYFTNDSLLVIPDVINYNGKEIEKFSLYNVCNRDDMIKYVYISEHVEKVINCFNECQNIEVISFSKSVKYINHMNSALGTAKEVIFADPYNWFIMLVDDLAVKIDDISLEENLKDQYVKYWVSSPLVKDYVYDKDEGR